MFCFHEKRLASGLLGTCLYIRVWRDDPAVIWKCISLQKYHRETKENKRTFAHERPQTRTQSKENSDKGLKSWRRKGASEKKENLNDTSKKIKVAIVVFMQNCKQNIYMCTLYLE